MQSIDFRIIEKEAAIISIAKKSIVKIAFVITKFEIVIISSGIDGIKNLRVIKTEINAGVPKIIAVLICTNPWLYFGMTPIKLLNPTMKSEYAVAVVGSIW